MQPPGKRPTRRPKPSAPEPGGGSVFEPAPASRAEPKATGFTAVGQSRWAGTIDRLLDLIPRRKHAPARTLADFFGKMQTMLAAGLRIDQAIQSSMPRVPSPWRLALQNTLERVRRGDEFGESLRVNGQVPPLVTELVTAAETAGALAEVCGFLSRHFEMRLQMRRRLVGRLAWPVTQFVLAVLVLTLFIWILGFIAELKGSAPIDPIGLGVGTTGAIKFLLLVVSVPVGGWLTYQILGRVFGQQANFHRLLLRVPVVSSVMRNLALSRFCWAFHLTAESGLRISQGAALSLRATNNPAFTSVVVPVTEGLEQGSEFVETLAATRLFPSQFLDQASVGETSGTLPETAERLATVYEGNAERAINAALWVVSIALWISIAAMIVMAIFRIFTSMVLGPIEQLL